MTKYITGVGSRNTPQWALDEITSISKALRSDNYVVRSGGAKGADRAFQDAFGDNTEIYLPWDNFNGLNSYDGTHINASKLDNFEKAKYIASMHCKHWDRLKDSHKVLHGRNAYQVLGFNLDSPSMVLICYAETVSVSHVKGGTNTAVQIALSHNVPVFNIYKECDLRRIKQILGIW